MSEQQAHSTLVDKQQQRNIHFLQYRFTPYFIIVLFSVAVTFMRYYMIPEWSLVAHIGLFFLQAITLTCVWFLIKSLNNYLDQRIPFATGAARRMILQILLTILIVGPFVFTFGVLLRPYAPSFVTTQFLTISCMIFVLVIFLFNFAFYAYYFFGNWQKSVEEKAQLQVQAADLQKERSKLQYHQLRNQVNPHYLFNTLTSLDGLIQTDPELASEFVRHMSKVYRYVLQHEENEVVSLEEEIEFIEHYVELLNIRYKEGLSIALNISAKAKERGMVMVTLQMLIDNAIKHNVVQQQSPLKIVIWDDGDYLLVHNNKQVRKQIDSSNGQGLKQLKQLYSFLSDKPVIVEDTDQHYTIKVPLIVI